MILQKKKLLNNFFECSQQFFEEYKKKIGHRACLGDIMGQTYPIYACTSNNHQRHFIGSQYIFLQLEPRVFKVPLEKNLIERKSPAYGTILYT